MIKKPVPFPDDYGVIIVRQPSSDTWLKSIVQPLVGDLQCELLGIGGFSAPKLWRMKNFHETYSLSEKLASIVREIDRSHYFVISERVLKAHLNDFLQAIRWILASVGSLFWLVSVNMRKFEDVRV